MFYMTCRWVLDFVIEGLISESFFTMLFSLFVFGFRRRLMNFRTRQKGVQEHLRHLYSIRVTKTIVVTPVTPRIEFFTVWFRNSGSEKLWLFQWNISPIFIPAYSKSLGFNWTFVSLFIWMVVLMISLWIFGILYFIELHVNCCSFDFGSTRHVELQDFPIELALT